MADDERAVGETSGGREQRERSPDGSSIKQREQPSALGGDVATWSSTRPTPPDEKAGSGA